MSFLLNPYMRQNLSLVADFETNSTSGLTSVTGSNGVSYGWATGNSNSSLWYQQSGEGYCQTQSGGGTGGQGGQTYLNLGVSSGFRLRFIYGAVSGLSNIRAGAMFNYFNSTNYAKAFYVKGVIYFDETINGAWNTRGTYSHSMVAGHYIDIYHYANHLVNIYLNGGANPIISANLLNANIQNATSHGLYSTYSASQYGTHKCRQWELYEL